MEDQLQVHRERPADDFPERRADEASNEVTEEQFLKELYLFMRKRDTPIERIPHLGFKQIDLFVMFKTVNNLGGYQQVTSQQLWKQVYNTLGGNPRSTSAATCTRRHYEKLLLPFECHKKGIVMSVVPQHPMKPFHYIAYDKADDCGPRPAKRKMLPLPLHQSHLSLHSDPHRSLFPLPLHYPHYFPAGHVILPPHVPLAPAMMAPHAGPVQMPRFPLLPPPPPPPQTPSHVGAAPERGSEPLEHLRSLSEWYKSSSGLVQQPLNLSTKAASPREIASAPVSSFSPPSTSKNPKFLNKPSTLYPSPHAGAPRSEGSDTPEESGEGGAASFQPRREPGDVRRARDSGSPGYAATSGTDDDIIEVSGKPSSPRTDLTARSRDDGEEGGDPRGLRPKEGDMEIEIPLSVFHNWLKLYRSSAMAHKVREAPPSAEEARAAQRSWLDTDALARNLTFHLRPRDEGAGPRSAPSPPPAVHAAAGQSRLPGLPAPPSGGAPRRAASAYPFDPPDVDAPFESRSFWDARADRSAARAPADFASKLRADDLVLAGRQRTEAGPSAAPTASSNPLLQLTTEEIVKLKKMISSSS